MGLHRLPSLGEEEEDEYNKQLVIKQGMAMVVVFLSAFELQTRVVETRIDCSWST